MSAEAIIACMGVYVYYGQEEILRDVTFEVKRGAFFPLVGPNGAGKSTLLKVLLGLVRCAQGRINTPFDRHPPGYVPQQASIDPMYPVTLRDIVAMGLYPRTGWWRRRVSEARRSMAEAINRVGLSGHESKSFLELSGGMRQKTLIARALVNGPDVLVLDEPTAGLDEESQREVLTHLMRLKEEHGTTVLMAHHGEYLLNGLAEEVCEIQHGRVLLRKPSDV